jgi:ABC-type multidrug transport system ATPase subunit
VAILGPSGAGKTTLLNILAGRIEGGTLSGRITLDGTRRTKRSWKRQTGYVEQEDIMYKTLTVRENIQYAAALRLPAKGWSKDTKNARTEAVLQRLGLLKCADTQIGDDMTRGISGGERKRVSIGKNAKLIYKF